jgi:hypothetical protein
MRRDDLHQRALAVCLLMIFRKVARALPGHALFGGVFDAAAEPFGGRFVSS